MWQTVMDFLRYLGIEQMEGISSSTQMFLILRLRERVRVFSGSLNLSLAFLRRACLEHSLTHQNISLQKVRIYRTSSRASEHTRASTKIVSIDVTMHVNPPYFMRGDWMLERSIVDLTSTTSQTSSTSQKNK